MRNGAPVPRRGRADAARRDPTAGSVYRALEAVADLVVLNALWLVSALAVVTIVPATAAMFTVVREWQLGSSTGAVRPFVRALREQLRRSFLLGVAWLAIAVVLAVDALALARMDPGQQLVLGTATAVVALAFACVSVQLCAVLASFDGDWRTILRTTVAVTFGMPASSLAGLAIAVVAALVVVTSPITAVVAGSASTWAIYRIYACRMRRHGGGQGRS